MRGGVIGIDGDSPANEQRRLLVIAGLRLQHSQQMQGIKVIGRLRQNLAVQRLGFGKRSALMAGDGLLKLDAYRRAHLKLAIFIAAATMGLAQSGVLLKYDGAAMRPARQCNNSLGAGSSPASGSPSSELS